MESNKNKYNPLALSEEKRKMIIKILEGLTFQQWQWLKHDIDALYDDLQLKNVPNGLLGTFQEKIDRIYIN